MLNFLKGTLVGIGKIIPGISGSMIAISLGIYNRMLKGAANITKLDKKEFIFLTQISLGILFAIIFLGRIIIFMMNKNYLITMFLFLGLIIGGIPEIVMKAKERKDKHLLIFILLPIIFFYLLSTLSFNNNIQLSYTNIILVGILESITMIIPGLSGTAILIYLGIYTEVLILMTTFNNIPLLFLFFIGVATGMLILSKIFSYIVDKYPYEVHYTVLGLTLSTSLIILKETLDHGYTFYQLIIGSMILIFSSFISCKMLK